jgi:hypothetical protein
MPDEGESAGERETATSEGPAALEFDSEELPDSVEETKVVLLPVNPHLVHVYWEIVDHDLEEVNRIFSRLGPRAQPVLRFYESAHAYFDGANASGWFEVEIALGAGSWYVRLESTAKFCCIDLGLCIEEGGFRRLARSNVAEIPRARPSDRIEESRLLVERDYFRAETLAPVPEGSGASRSAPTYAEPYSGEGKWALGWDATRSALTYSEPHGSEENRMGNWGASETALPYGEHVDAGESGPKGSESWPSAPAWAEQWGPEESGQRGREGWRSASAYAEPWGEEENEPESRGGSESTPTNLRGPSPGEIGGKLEELYRLGLWEWAGFTHRAGGATELQHEGKDHVDLTELSERSFRAGVSSGRKSS